MEGRPEKNLKYIAWKPCVRILRCNRCLERKRTRLFIVKQVVGNNFSTFSENFNLQKNLFIYKTAIQEKNLYEAFKSLKTQHSFRLNGLTKTSSIKHLENSVIKLHKHLKSHEYKPNPIKIVCVPKSNGSKKLLGISSVRDKIVQATFKKELQVLYELIFRNCSFGFRPKLSCHSALKQIKKKWQAIKWFISLDILNCFDRVQHKILISVLKQNVADQETIELIQKLLKVGYVNIHNLTKREEHKTENIVEGSILSPLLANIYLHELDVFIQDVIIPKNVIVEKRLVDKANEHRRNSVLKNKMKDNPLIEEFSQLKEIIQIWKSSTSTLNMNANYYKEKEYYKRLHYIRYADDILLGVVGTKKDC